MFALDIETIRNDKMIKYLPNPKVKYGNTVDPEKRKKREDEAKQKQIEDMGLHPETGRICSFAVYGEKEEDRCCFFIQKISDKEEINLIKELLEWLVIGKVDRKGSIVTWNGNAFDFPYIYKRALILGISLPVNVPGLNYWTRRYSFTPHCDLMKWWDNWSNDLISLNYVANFLLGEGKTDRNYLQYIDLIKNEKSDKIGEDNICDARLTYEIYKKVEKYFFGMSYKGDNFKETCY